MFFSLASALLETAPNNTVFDARRYIEVYVDIDVHTREARM